MYNYKHYKEILFVNFHIILKLKLSRNSLVLPQFFLTDFLINFFADIFIECCTAKTTLNIYDKKSQRNMVQKIYLFVQSNLQLRLSYVATLSYHLLCLSRSVHECQLMIIRLSAWQHKSRGPASNLVSALHTANRVAHLDNFTARL